MRKRRRLRLSIRYKLALLLLVVGGGAAVVSGALGYSAARQSLRESVLERLQGLGRTKAHQVESYLRTVRSHAASLGEDRMVLEALREADGARAADDDRVLRGLVKRHGYAGLLLLDGQGRVVFPAGKRGQEVVAEVYRRTRDARQAGVFEAGWQGTAVLAASPVWDEGQVAGVVVLQVSQDELDRVVSGEQGWERDGLGKTGDAVIVGEDGRARTATRVALGGEGRLVSRAELAIPGLEWSLVTEMDEAEALLPVAELGRRLLFWGLVLVLLMGGAAMWLAGWLVRPLGVLFRAARRVASGHYDTQVPIPTHDELGLLAAQFNSLASSIQRQSAEIQEKNRENELLLLNILPGPIAERLKDGEERIVDSFACVTVLFADIVGFTVLSGRESPGEVVAMLNDLFSHFDALAAENGVEKIKTIGDAYMAVAGLPATCEDHARRMVEMARGMLQEIRRHSQETGMPLSIRIGINSGPVVAGVIGRSKFIYDLWGDTVNVASRMESHGVPDRVQVTQRVYELLRDEYEFECRGEIEVKGKGKTQAWLLREL